MFLHESEKMLWLASDRRARLLQEAAVDRLLSTSVAGQRGWGVSALLGGWRKLGQLLLLVAPHRPVIGA